MGLKELFHRSYLFFFPWVYPEQSPIPLQTAEPVKINLDGFVKGIDNFHFDVFLSPQFQYHARKFIVAMVDQEVGHFLGSAKRTGPSRQQWEHYHNAYTKMINAAVYRAKDKECPPLVQLAQIAAIKFLQEQVKNELARVRNNLRNAAAAGVPALNNADMELVQQRIWFSRNSAQLNYKVLRRMLAPIIRAEEGDLGELRHSLMGVQWSLPKEFFNNPLLQADSPFDEVFLVKHYVLIKQGQLQDDENTYSYNSIDGILPYLFRTIMPKDETEAKLNRTEALLVKAQKVLDGINRKMERSRKIKNNEQDKQNKLLVERLVAAFRDNYEQSLEEFLKTHYVWADVPANAELLFDEVLSAEKIKEAKKSNDRAMLAMWKNQHRFQRRLLSIVERRFRRSGLLKQIVAAYELVPLIRDSRILLLPWEIHKYLIDYSTRKDVLEQIKRKNPKGKLEDIALLTKLCGRVRGLSRQYERELLIKFLKDFLTFRRDLAYFKNLQQVSTTIALRNDSQELQLSKENRTLYEFYGTGEKQAATKKVLNHVILKADIRGSTEIVNELRKRSLNPASHFSINFYNPLNALIKNFGVGKVFIEGDAVILSMVEHEEVLENRFSVACMCGIGERLLSLVRAQNAVCRKHGLPELDLGIGIVFCNEPPMFLFDGDHPIMISSAIGKADRLSSCSWLLRKEHPEGRHAFSNVDIYEIPEGDRRRGEKGEIFLRYNMNGIELDDDGFAKLQSELTLQEIKITLPGDSMPTSFFYGRYPDTKKTLRRIVVRQGYIRIFDRQHPQFGIPTERVFYEVVANKNMLSQVEEAVTAQESAPQFSISAINEQL